MRVMNIYKNNKYRPVICRISQKPMNDRKIKTVKFLVFFFFFFFFFSLFFFWLSIYKQLNHMLNHCATRNLDHFWHVYRYCYKIYFGNDYVVSVGRVLLFRPVKFQFKP